MFIATRSLNLDQLRAFVEVVERGVSRRRDSREPVALACVVERSLWTTLGDHDSFITRRLMASKRGKRPKRRDWSKEDVRELKAHSRSKSPVNKIAKAGIRQLFGRIAEASVLSGFSDPS